MHPLLPENLIEYRSKIIAVLLDISHSKLEVSSRNYTQLILNFVIFLHHKQQ
jgi:hypothetical protein